MQAGHCAFRDLLPEENFESSECFQITYLFAEPHLLLEVCSPTQAMDQYPLKSLAQDFLPPTRLAHPVRVALP